MIRKGIEAVFYISAFGPWLSILVGSFLEAQTERSGADCWSAYENAAYVTAYWSPFSAGGFYSFIFALPWVIIMLLAGFFLSVFDSAGGYISRRTFLIGLLGGGVFWIFLVVVMFVMEGAHLEQLQRSCQLGYPVWF